MEPQKLRRIRTLPHGDPSKNPANILKPGANLPGIPFCNQSNWYSTLPESDPQRRDDVDRALALRARDGDELAIRELVQAHQGVVLRLCQRMLGNRHDAEDVVQEAFVRAVRGLRGWDSTRALRPWLLAIAANRCRTALARRRSIPSDTQVLAEELPERESGGHGLRHLNEEVQLALGELRSEYRQAFELFHFEQLAYADIAEVLEVPVGTVKTWMHRARQEVAARLISRGVVEQVTERFDSNEVRNALPAIRVAAASVTG